MKRKNKSSTTNYKIIESFGNINSHRKWKNKLIWGDVNLVLSSIILPKDSSIKRQTENNGGVKLVYLDPPFNVGTNFSLPLQVGNTINSQLSTIAYCDNRASSEYINWLRNILQLIHNLLSDDGSIYVHCDWRVNSYIRLLLDTVFGQNNFRNEIIWHYEKWTAPSDKSFQKNHDTIYYYTKSNNYTFNTQYTITENLASKYKTGYSLGGGHGSKGLIVYDPDNPKVRELIDSGKYIVTYADSVGKPMSDVFDLPFINPTAKERTNYPTQKPEALLETIIKTSSNAEDIIADFFCGSGTLPVVAEKLGRKWIATDLGKYAIHTTRKRLLANGFSNFEILKI